ncbi:MAG: FAD/NAD(P)-binding protein [Devosia nanyangense]|uniref:FAD/NAD(P)-binding protein n=1 Tax=Devosia nanyangense TaxID=1228055 RepID=A0A933L2I9_9HYPH|nr:FAD/NAD(P)-binding protein [Devosia nanyangense]
MALQLARKSLDIEVILVERTDRPGRGLAYGTTCAEHVVNVVPGRLSAFADDPNHFVRWLHRSGMLPAPESFAFVSRHLVGDYLAEMLGAAGPNLTIVQDEVTTLNDTGAGVEVSLKSSPPLFGDTVILATGHGWIRQYPEPASVPPDVPVTILGTGLSMIDRWLSLRTSGHRGPITAVSRLASCPTATPPASVSTSMHQLFPSADQ